MRIWNRIVGTIYILCGVFLVVNLLLLWAQEKLIDAYAVILHRHLFRAGIAGMVVVLIGVVWLVNWFDTIYRSKAISFDYPGGRVKISLKAIEEFINSRIITQMAGVRGLKVRTALSSRGLETIINLQLLAGTNIPEMCGSIQEITKNYLQDVVGVERVASIEVFVSNIIVKNDGDTPPAAAKPAEGEASGAVES